MRSHNMHSVPKIDWRDDDQPRLERFGRPSRRRIPLGLRVRPVRSWDFGAPAAPLEPPVPLARRPLHLIWGPPVPRNS